MSDIAPGQIGPYEVLREIGRGGMGVVLLARDVRLQRDVAIKSLAPGFTEDEERLARFRRESRIIAQLNHPHIAQVYHLLEHKGQVHLVLEYVPGRSLAEMIDQGGALNLETALGLCAQIALAMEAAHFRGIIHRDLKPANIRVTDDGIAKVLDFGIARFSRGDGDAGSAGIAVSEEPGIGPTTMAGTPGYMAPEQAEGEQVDARADIFSFGCILHECLTGEPAFPGATIADRIAATRTTEPDETKLPTALSDGVSRLLRHCLAKNVADRLQNISDARAALDAALGRHVIHTPHPTSEARIADNLPALTTSFVGRSEQLEDLSRLLSEARLLTLTGAGGAGKTRLALELARRVRERFSDGVYLVELATITNPDLIPAAVAAALGVKDRAKSTTTDVL